MCVWCTNITIIAVGTNTFNLYLLYDYEMCVCRLKFDISKPHIYDICIHRSIELETNTYYYLFDVKEERRTRRKKNIPKEMNGTLVILLLAESELPLLFMYECIEFADVQHIWSTIDKKNVICDRYYLRKR